MSEWIEWAGGKCPVVGVSVETRRRDDSVRVWAASESLYWEHLGGGSDIVAYRVVESVAGDEKVSNPKDIVGVRKAPMSTVSGPVLAEIGVGMLEGACKYGRHNYRAVGVRASVYYDATMRHLFSWWEGEDLDPHSGMSHIAKAITSLVVLRDAMIQGTMSDDRPPASPEFYKELNALAANIIDRHADKNPHHYTSSEGVAK